MSPAPLACREDWTLDCGVPNESGVDQQARRWDAAYTAGGAEGVSWYQAEPAVSLELIEVLQIPHDAAVIDIGGGASLLLDRLVERDFSDLTVLDVSAFALQEHRRQLGDSGIVRLHEDVLEWSPQRRYDLWHDRALFHFLVTEADRRRYVETLHAAIPPGGFLIVATFALDAPERCSGLPVTRYSPDLLSHVLGDTFEPLETRREVHTTPREVIQPFTWVAGRIAASS